MGDGSGEQAGVGLAGDGRDEVPEGGVGVVEGRGGFGPDDEVGRAGDGERQGKGAEALFGAVQEFGGPDGFVVHVGLDDDGGGSAALWFGDSRQEEEADEQQEPGAGEALASEEDGGDNRGHEGEDE